MNQITVTVENVNGKLVVSSRVIAEQLGKRHDHIIRDLQKILTNPNVGALIIPSEYKDKKGEMRKKYLLTKDGFILYMFNIQGYNDFKMAYINRFNQMEQQLQNKFQVPGSFAEALRLAADQQEKIETLKLDNKIKDQQIQELKPKATYYDLILQCKDLLSVTEIAKDYGMSAMAFNKKLHELKVQFKQSGVWFLYQKYASYGYTQTKTQNYNKPDGSQGVSTHMYWTQKGRLFLYDFLKDQGIVPMIEREEE